jgi:hypothetical protein
MLDTGANNGVFYDTRFFDPATLYNRSAITTLYNGTLPTQQYTYGTVHFVLKGDRGDKVSITFEDMKYVPSADANLMAATRLHAYGLTSVVSPDKALSGLWYDFNKPTARKFASFIIQDGGLPYLRPCAIGVSAIARRLAWLSNLKAHVPQIWTVCSRAAAGYAWCHVTGAIMLGWGGSGAHAICFASNWLLMRFLVS